MRRLCFISLIALGCLAMQGCEMISSFLHDGKVVAKVGRARLYQSDIQQLVPPGTAPEDSLAIVRRYIDTWAADQVFLHVAGEKLSKNEKNLARELEQYKNALLRYRYEQMYVNERLDTAVTEEHVKEYYESHKDVFRLNYPIARARFIRVIPGTVDIRTVRAKIASDNAEDVADFENIVYSCSDRYNDFGGRYVEITALAREFGTDYGTLLSQMSNSFIQIEDAEGRVCLAYISDYMRSGSVPPVEYCRDKIENVIISARKQKLLDDLERELLEDARVTGLFEIIEENE